MAGTSVGQDDQTRESSKPNQRGDRLMATHVIHVEVVGKDGPKLQKFYADAFGWGLDTNNPDGYGMYREESGLTAGFGKSPDGGAGHVTFYVHTDDPKGTLARVEKLGGKVIMPLTQVAPETTIALFADPEGHIVGLM
jgi:predicted enzyme related to lactoylglutathione lyase